VTLRFHIARAALSSAGVREDKLPRTHSGLIGLFSKHAVLSGFIDQKLFAVLGQPARCFNVDHYFAKPITTAAIGLAQFGMEDTRLRILPSRKCSS
jgi:hypothetical protein